MNPLDFVKKLTVDELAQKIDHAILKPWTSLSEAEKALDELEELNLRCLIATPQLARSLVDRTRRCVGSVVGFPFGYSTIEAKIKELEDVIGYGVKEVDLVVNHHAFSIGLRNVFENEVKAVTEICRETGVTCKLIVETVAYPPATVKEMVKLVARYEPDYIKTSTGYGPRPTLPDDVHLLRSVLDRLGKRRVRIKAAGGIRTALQALTLIALGADVIGTSTPKQILDGFKELKGKEG